MATNAATSPTRGKIMNFQFATLPSFTVHETVTAVGSDSRRRTGVDTQGR